MIHLNRSSSKEVFSFSGYVKCHTLTGLSTLSAVSNYDHADNIYILTRWFCNSVYPCKQSNLGTEVAETNSPIYNVYNYAYFVSHVKFRKTNWYLQSIRIDRKFRILCK